MIMNKYVRFSLNYLRFAYGNWKKTMGKAQKDLIKHQSLVNKINSHKDRAMNVYKDQPDIQLARSVRLLDLKDFSVKVHHVLREKEKSIIFWSSIQEQFLERLKPTTDPVKIRSYSKIIYSLSKSKKATANYETKMSIILPFATPQSFTTIITSLSRIAPFSQEMSYIIQKLYYKRKAQLRPREIIAVNYSLSNNGRKCDKEMIQYIDSLNAIETITMLRSYDKSDLVTQELLKKCLLKLKSLQNEFNVLDLSDIIYIYLKHEYITEDLQQLLKNSYNILRRNINDICLQKIWTYLPATINRGRLKIKFIEQIISTLQILRKSSNMSEIIWKNIHPTFKNIENIQLKLRLEKIY